MKAAMAWAWQRAGKCNEHRFGRESQNEGHCWPGRGLPGRVFAALSAHLPHYATPGQLAAATASTQAWHALRRSRAGRGKGNETGLIDCCP